MWPEL